MYESHILPTPTSIRLLDIIESRDDLIRCSMSVVDLDDEDLEFAAISYTWGDPITVHEDPMPDITGLTLEEHADQLPFSYFTSPMGPNGESICMVDRAKLDFYAKYDYIPREELRWKNRSSREVEIDGNRVPVEENLFLCFEALLNIRKQLDEASGGDNNQDSEKKWPPVWADALCINQADLVERASQVKLMGQLYRTARWVYAWVGKLDRLSHRALLAMGTILDFDATRSHARDSSYPEQEEVTLSSVPGMTVVDWFALFALFQRLWFRRAWVAQEVVFAHNIHMICGPTVFDMSLVLAVVAFFEETGLDYELCQLGRNFLTDRATSDQTQHWEKLVSFSSQSPNTMKELQVNPRDALSFILGFHRTRARLGLSNAGMPMRRPLHLLSVLSHFRDLEATDPRDKIFAFLNLAEDKLGLVPNYSADVRDVFIQAARAMINKRMGSILAVLSHLQDSSDTRIQGLPSWVPDFSARLGRIPFDQGGHDVRFCAGTSLEIDIEDFGFHFNPDDTLTVKAIKVDQVAVSTQLGDDPVTQALRLALRGPPRYPINPRAWFMNGDRHIRPSRAVTRVEALWRTLVIDNLTEMEEDYSSLESRDNLGIGFSNWILTDILEARDLLLEWVKLEQDQWTRILIEKSFCTRMALWSAMYDGKQLSDELEIPDLEKVLEDQTGKVEREFKKPDEQEEEEEEEGDGSLSQREFLPTATHIRECFHAQVDEAQGNGDPLRGKYKRPSMQRLTPLERRKLRNFEKNMRSATEGRKLFMTESGLFGLGPKSLGQDPSSKDEVWILVGARVPFILHHVEGCKYRVVGEAYVHGIIGTTGNMDTVAPVWKKYACSAPESLQSGSMSLKQNCDHGGYGNPIGRIPISQNRTNPGRNIEAIQDVAVTKEMCACLSSD
ncbi:heterokaryon incompatibility protein-domain-containing protein [Fusarium solani]|uniref:Heterokaryon incompatibility protein-domain-containing protein n=1 Tax=Fusarium solani TaxID=169388 RepID=A0A9P9GVI9_FUSSL|nr:heterokaryon incompatibility protein-domain-containing protein [Fusarium solani]KAH7244927.1 heterokaryon incompatibility protein-domain-containing protein [Fusarium solani]